MKTATWNTNDLAIEDCARISGWSVEELRAKLARTGFLNTAKCRAAGAWDANNREMFAVWSSLARMAAVVGVR